MQGWREAGRYHHKLTEAAFAWHRLHNGDIQAQQHLERLEEEALTLRARLNANRPIQPPISLP
jgi:hypothetical protein